MTLPFLVVESGARALEDARGELLSRGWAVHESRLAGGPGTIWAVTVADPLGASEAVLAALGGMGLLVEGTGPREVLDPLCDDLRRLGHLDHRVEEPVGALTVEEHALMRLLADGSSIGDAARALHLSRRSVDRRLASARRALEADSTGAAVAAYLRRIERMPRTGH